MRNLTKELSNKQIDYDKLLKYGFIKNNNEYLYKTKLSNNQFEVYIEISPEKQISKIIDLSINEEYIPVDIQNTIGKYVGMIKEEYEYILNDIINKCTIPHIFKNTKSKLIIKYIKDKYNDDLEFLWSKFPTNAIWRNKSNKKWYGIMMVIEENKLGISSNKNIEILNLRYQKEIIHDIIDNKIIYPGYHMNKKNWITIKLDNTLNINYIYKLIDNSYKLSIKK